MRFLVRWEVQPPQLCSAEPCPEVKAAPADVAEPEATQVRVSTFVYRLFMVMSNHIIIVCHHRINFVNPSSFMLAGWHWGGWGGDGAWHHNQRGGAGAGPMTPWMGAAAASENWSHHHGAAAALANSG